MKQSTGLKFRIPAVCVAAAVLALMKPTGAVAQGYYPRPFYYYSEPEHEVGFYLGADLGADFMQRVQTTRFGFGTAFTPRAGTRFGIEPGFNFLSTPYLTLAGEFETGVSYNYLSGVNVPAVPYAVHGDYYQVPLLGNLILKLKTDSIVEPYVGIGGGGDYSSVTLRNYGYGYYGYRTSSDEVDPAVQGMIGVRFHVSPWSEVGVGYKYLAAFNGGGNVINTHTAQASFTVNF